VVLRVLVVKNTVIANDPIVELFRTRLDEILGVIRSGLGDNARGLCLQRGEVMMHVVGPTAHLDDD